MLYNVSYENKNPIHYRICSQTLNDSLNVLELGYNRVPHGLKQVMTRNVYIIHYVISGKGRFLDQLFKAGDIYTVVPNQLEIIEADSDDPYEIYWIMLHGSAVPTLFEKMGLPKQNGIVKFEGSVRCADIIDNYLFNQSYCNELDEASAMQLALYELSRVHFSYNTEFSEKTDRRAEEIARFIENNYHYDIKISQLAKNFCLSQNYICSLFKKEYGVTPQEYLISLRIEKAKKLLMQNDKKLSIAQIAEAVGFEEPLYFSKSFHKRTGMSPSKFKRYLQ